MNYINVKKMTAVLMLTVMILTCRFFMSSGLIDQMGVEGIKSTIESFGYWAPIVYMIMFSVIPSGYNERPSRARARLLDRVLGGD